MNAWLPWLQPLRWAGAANVDLECDIVYLRGSLHESVAHMHICGDVFAFGRYRQMGLGWRSTLTPAAAMQNCSQDSFPLWGAFLWIASMICGQTLLG